MAERTYNTGRVVGWSAYEEFLKEYPNIDPSVITEQIYTTAVTFGVTRIVNLPLTNWSGTNILTKTVAVPGAVWGAVPIAGIYYDGLTALEDTATAATAKEHALEAAGSIFACYCSDAQGHKLANATSSSGYITFCAHPEVVSTGLTILPLIMRGLGLEGLSDGNAYFGPEGLIGGSGNGDCIITDHTITHFKLTGSPDAWGQWFNIEFNQGSRWIAGLSFLDMDATHSSDAFPTMHDLSGSDTDTTTGANSVPIQLTTGGGDLTSSSVTYAGYFNWMDLTRMMVTNQMGRISFTIDKLNVGNPTYIDITHLFSDKAYIDPQEGYRASPAFLACELRLGDTKAYPLLAPWPGVTDTPADSAYDGYFRVVLKLYPAPLGTTSKFDMLILSYLKNDITLTSPESSNWRSSGFTWRGAVSDDCFNYVVNNYPAMSANRDQMSLITHSAGSVSGFFQPSDPRTVFWNSVPEASSAHLGPVNYLMSKSFDVTSTLHSWQVDFTIKGSSLAGSSDNDRLYGIDRSCASDATSSTSALTTVAGGTISASSTTWSAATTMDSLIADFNPSHASYYTTMSGIYTTI